MSSAVQKAARREAKWEAKFQSRLNGLKLGKVKRKAEIGPYTVDFLLVDAKLIVEFEGERRAYSGQAFQDSQENDYFATRGYEIIRFWNHELDDGFERAVEAIEAKAKARLAERAPETRKRGFLGFFGRKKS
jgi:very-short-patch-repair endonuclease